MKEGEAGSAAESHRLPLWALQERGHLLHSPSRLPGKPFFLSCAEEAGAGSPVGDIYSRAPSASLQEEVRRHQAAELGPGGGRNRSCALSHSLSCHIVTDHRTYRLHGDCGAPQTSVGT